MVPELGRYGLQLGMGIVASHSGVESILFRPSNNKEKEKLCALEESR